jgi:hypothetical protein
MINFVNLTLTIVNGDRETAGDSMEDGSSMFPPSLAPPALCNITGFGAKCPKCETINTITLENGELRKQV